MDSLLLEKAIDWVRRHREASRRYREKGTQHRTNKTTERTTDEQKLERYLTMVNNNKLRYIHDKEDLKQKYEDNKEERILKQRAYYEKNKKEINERSKLRRAKAKADSAEEPKKRGRKPKKQTTES